ncbi:DUF447 domain-containing protein [Paraburkholderia oxyphila]|uniref:DUF447 domain-containing protein n=1 Tax=Paraburkholderia oxyphila TaxID=614212 RepID=UPI0004816DFE|nr:DUF447 domain-containing protein [Paraburkholderia oxyphila]
MIHETVVTTCSADGTPHVAPMGARFERGNVVLMPFTPSTTYDNIMASGCAVMNFTTDVRVFAGCVTGRRSWPTLPASTVPCVRLAGTLAHAELRLVDAGGDPGRPVLTLRRVAEASHAPFTGFNRAQAAVIEAAVLVSRLHLLPREKIETEMAWHTIAIEKTAGPAEREAWQWLTAAVAAFYSNSESPNERACVREPT